MNNEFHPTAIIHPLASLGKNNVIGPYCYIGPDVVMGDNNHFFGYASVGMSAEHKDYFGRRGKVVIGSRNVVREFATINGGTTRTTTMANDCIMLRGSHLSHDSILENGVTVSCDVKIGGESIVMEGANLGLGCIIHQRQVIGSWAMVGAGCVVPKTKDIEVGRVYVGNPARYLKENMIGLTRAEVSEFRRGCAIDRYWKLRKGE